MRPRDDNAQIPASELSLASEDCGGWWSTWLDTGSRWRGWIWDDSERPRVYYPAERDYPDGDEYLGVDGLGREISSRASYECFIDPVSGKFRRLCVQTRNSYCKLPNGRWERTCLRESAPAPFAMAVFPFKHIPAGRRENIKDWTGEDWALLFPRWILSMMGIGILMFVSNQKQPMGKDPHAYLPFLYNGYRYPRLARNFQENREEIKTERPNDHTWATGDIGVYRVLRPRLLCYITLPENPGQDSWFETREVPENDTTPYVFISYTKSQFTEENHYEELYAWAIHAVESYATSVHGVTCRPKAFWIGASCLEYPDSLSREAAKRLADHDTYSMSDVIRGAEHTIVIVRDEPATDSKTALQKWGDRVWTLPEVLLSKGDIVTVVDHGRDERQYSKLQLADAAWADATYSRQLVEHFTNLHLSRLELVSIALKCLNNRRLEQLHRGDRSYALMGLLRVRPGIDSTDSSFQAFARLSLPQDNDRLMERLICLLPETPGEAWDKMTDQYKSTLWDIYPDTQVCGVGENDTIIVDGFKGAMIQWSMFSTVQTSKRITGWRTFFIVVTHLFPYLFILGVILTDLLPKKGWEAMLTLSLVILALTPLYIPALYKGKLTMVEPCLFGVEGYVPLPVLEELLFGARMDRLKWSPNGSPLSRHWYRRQYRERQWQEKDEGDEESQPLAPGEAVTDVYSYPMEALDPCAVCPQCVNPGGDQVRVCGAGHPTPSSLDAESRNERGMKVFTLIDTYSMTATLFRAYRPPVMIMVGGSEGGMKRTLACSYDVATGTLYRETVLRMPSRTIDCMHSLPRVRLGLNNPRNQDIQVGAGTEADRLLPYANQGHGSYKGGDEMETQPQMYASQGS